MNELETMVEKTLEDDSIITISRAKGGFDVDNWDKDGNNRWHRFFADIKKAQSEFDRWN